MGRRVTGKPQTLATKGQGREEHGDRRADKTQPRRRVRNHRELHQKTSKSEGTFGRARGRPAPSRTAGEEFPRIEQEKIGIPWKTQTNKQINPKR